MDATTIAAGAFALNAIGAVGGLVWAVANIKADIAKQIASEREETTEQIAQLRADFLKDQKSQDHNFGEVGAAMRQYITDVEKKLHEVEIWGRDNYVQKGELADLRADIRAFAADIKKDFRELNAKIDAKQ